MATYMVKTIIAGAVGLVFGLVFVAGMYAGQTTPNWNCNAEDEVLIIDNTCVHIDTIKGEL